MSRFARRQAADSRQELARLLPPPADPDLPADRLRVLKEHLMVEIRTATPTPPPPVRSNVRRKAIAGSLAGALALGLAGWVALGGSDGGAPPKDGAGRAVGPVVDQQAVQLLNRAAVAADVSPLAVRDDQFVYVDWKLINTTTSNISPDATVNPPYRRQIWESVNGSRTGWLIQPGLSTDGRGIANSGNRSPNLNSPNYRYLESLPTDPDALLAKIYSETRGRGTGPQAEAFVTIGDLLRAAVLPPRLIPALYRAAAKIPGVTVVKNAADASGRRGVAVSRTDSTDGVRYEWIFDADTLDYLGDRTVTTRTYEGLPPGTVTGASAVLNRGVVDRVGQIPPTR